MCCWLKGDWVGRSVAAAFTRLMIDKVALAALRERDYEHYLALWLVPQADRAFALALFNLEFELRTIPAKVTEPTLGLMRIIWWRDAVAEGAMRAHPLLLALRRHINDAERAKLAAAWIESFDLPFLPEAEQNERLLLRYDLASRLYGKMAVQYLRNIEERSEERPIIMIFQAFKAVFF